MGENKMKMKEILCIVGETILITVFFAALFGTGIIMTCFE